ncbi:hypothetical protein B566_EDAN003788 [Ephemera danica]|nr:hypothetical protein B566_EDAN003788 [Ephemera danica]
MQNYKENEVKIVPWISMAEWKDVYRQIYSEKPEDKLKGYESLRVWKSRCSNLPKAVECTLLLVHVQVKDLKNCKPVENDKINFDDTEKDYCMMYCTALTRCLNHILSLDPKKSSIQSMFMMAKGLHIPSWVVQLRHDVSHGTELPSLATLRHGTQVLLDWLQDNYWKAEEDNTWDWVPGSELTVYINKLVYLLDTWQSVHLFLRANFGTAGQIPEQSLQDTLFEMRREYLSGTPRSRDSNCRNWKLKHALSYLNKEIISLITQDSYAKELASIVADSKGFLVSADVISLYTDDKISPGELTSLPRNLLQQWREILCLLYCAQVLPDLMTKLVEICCCTKYMDSFQCKIAALWLKELSQSLLKLQKVQALLIREGFTVKSRFSVKKYTATQQKCISGMDVASGEHQRTVVDNKLFSKVQSMHPELTTALRLPTWVAVPSSSVFLQLVRQAVQNPTTWHSIYLPSMLELVGSCIPRKNKEGLLELMSLYLDDTEDLYPTNGEVHTVAEFSQEVQSSENSRNEDISAQTVPQISSAWSLYSGVWKDSALGRLPWQQDIKSADFIMSENWVPCDVRDDQMDE